MCPEDKGGDGKTDRLDDCPRGSDGWNEYREQERARIEACYDNNRFSSLFGDGAIRTGVEFVEIGSLISVGTDLIAIALKGGGALGTKNAYASGFNMIGRTIARNTGRRELIGTVTKVGDKVTPILAVIGVGTAAYNITTDVQCRLGLIE
mgnify:CR=1 FL=1